MEPNRTEPSTDRTSHYRPHLIVIFAIAMAWFAASAGADEILPTPALPTPVSSSQSILELPSSPSDDDSSVPAPLHSIQWDATHEIPADHPTLWKRVGSRPVSVDLTSWLANFDADAQPDGWRARVMLRDIDGNAVVMRSHATFTLVPRVPLADHQQFITADDQSITWSMPLRFDEQGAASVTLPLRRSQEPAFGWSSALAPHPFDSVGSRSRNNGRYRGSNIPISRVYTGRNRHAVGGVSYTRLDVPSSGVMRVRVSVPTEGVFEAKALVRTRDRL